jgi:uncharacterized protein (TIGR02687 family)
MLQDKINTYFQRNPNLKILFFFDAEGIHLSEVQALDMPDIRVKLFASDWFNAKIELNTLAHNEKVFFYLPMESPHTNEDYLNFPLLGLLKANKELRTDDVAGFMEEFRLLTFQQSLVKRYMSELKYSQTQQVLKPYLNATGFDERNVQQGLFCAFLELPKMEDWDTIMVRLLCYSLPNKDKELKRFLKKTVDLGLLDALNKQLRLYFDTYIANAIPSEIIELVKRLKYNSIVQGLVKHDADPYKSLRFIDTDCYEALNRIREMGMNHPTMSKPFAEVLEVNGATIQESKLIELYGQDAEYIYLTDTLKWEMIKRVLSQMSGQWLEAEKQLEQLSIQTQEDGMLKDTLAFLRYSIGMLSKINQIPSVIWDKPEEYLKHYTSDYYLIDLYYRKSVLYFRNLDASETPIEELLEQLKQDIESRYAQFIYTLNHEWLACFQTIGYEYKYLKAQKQYDFFKNYISPLKQKVAVIISDALRYEVAHELMNELHKDDKNVSELAFQLASIPSETSFGMANLLPGNNYAYDGEIRIDGEKTNGIDNRDKILKKQSANYQAVSFENILNGTKQSNRELFKTDVVYIYHDIIDKEGHKGTERNVFQSTQIAIAELAKMVKGIQGGFGINKVIITSDHGFIYNDTEIEEADKNEMANCEMTETGARHYVTIDNPDITIGHKIPLFKTTKFKEPYYAIIPDSVNRFKKAGSRYKFTHGGGSLQELIVPVVISSRREDKIQRKVNPLLLSQNLAVVSNNLKIQLVQGNPLSAKEKERTIEIALYSDTMAVSNKIQLTLNSASELPSERIFTVALSLNTKTTDSILKLRIYDKDDLLNPLIEDNVKNNTLIERDF